MESDTFIWRIDRCLAGSWGAGGQHPFGQPEGKTGLVSFYFSTFLLLTLAVFSFVFPLQIPDLESHFYLLKPTHRSGRAPRT